MEIKNPLNPILCIETYEKYWNTFFVPHKDELVSRSHFKWIKDREKPTNSWTVL